MTTPYILRDLYQSELKFLILLENSEPNVLHWPLGKHRKNLADKRYIYKALVPDHRFHNKPISSYDDLLGYVIIKKDSPNKKYIELVRIVLKENIRNKGVGKFIFKQVWEWAFKTEKCSAIWHDVFSHNTYAIRFYEKLGYKKVKEILEPKTKKTLFVYKMSKEDYETNNLI